MRLLKTIQIIFLLALSLSAQAVERAKLNFNADWELHIGDLQVSSVVAPSKVSPTGDEGGAWQRVTLPYAFNGDEAFKKDIVDLTDTICWYRKSFALPPLLWRGRGRL